MAEGGIKQFDPDREPGVVAREWGYWISEFEVFADSKGLFDADGADGKTNRLKRRALLLFHGGRRVREIFETLPDTGEKDQYKAAVKALKAYFIDPVKQNPTVHRHAFRKLVQKEGESISQFISRLRKAAQHCDFPDEDDQIRDQCVSQCRSQALRVKFLEHEGDLKLKDVLKIGSSSELVAQRLKDLSLGGDLEPQEVSVNRVAKPFKGASGRDVPTYSKKSHSDVECFRCGKKGHYASDTACPARGKVCTKCGGRNHFAVKCRTEKQTKPGNTRDVNQVTSSSDGSNTNAGHSFAFNLKQKSSVLKRAVVNVGGVEVEAILDTGCDCNIVSLSQWQNLKGQGIKCTSQKGGPAVYAYTADSPLPVIGRFQATVRTGKGKRLQSL